MTPEFAVCARADADGIIAVAVRRMAARTEETALFTLPLLIERPPLEWLSKDSEALRPEDSGSRPTRARVGDCFMPALPGASGDKLRGPGLTPALGLDRLIEERCRDCLRC